MKNRPLLHVSINYLGNSILKTNLKNQLSAYTVRLLGNPLEPPVDICLDTISAKEENQVQQELVYDTVVSNHTKHRFTTTKELFTIVILLISLTI